MKRHIDISVISVFIKRKTAWLEFFPAAEKNQVLIRSLSTRKAMVDQLGTYKLLPIIVKPINKKRIRGCFSNHREYKASQSRI